MIPLRASGFRRCHWVDDRCLLDGRSCQSGDGDETLCSAAFLAHAEAEELAR